MAKLMKKWLIFNFNWVKNKNFRQGGKIQLCLDLFSATLTTKENEPFRGKGFSVRIQFPAKLLLWLQETKDILTPAENKSFYYIVAVVDSDRKLMVFECTETFIVNILKFSNKTVLEEEFTKK